MPEGHPQDNQILEGNLDTQSCQRNLGDEMIEEMGRKKLKSE